MIASPPVWYKLPCGPAHSWHDPVQARAALGEALRGMNCARGKRSRTPVVLAPPGPSGRGRRLRRGPTEVIRLKRVIRIARAWQRSRTGDGMLRRIIVAMVASLAMAAAAAAAAQDKAARNKGKPATKPAATRPAEPG